MNNIVRSKLKEHYQSEIKKSEEQLNKVIRYAPELEEKHKQRKISQIKKYITNTQNKLQEVL